MGGEAVEELKSDSETDGGETGMRKTRRTRDPLLPTKDELHEHEKTHLPYKDWCPHCVRGRGREMAKKRTQEEDGMPEIHIDYCFPKSADGKAVTFFWLRESGRPG